MDTVNDLATRLSNASVKKQWDVYSAFDWPERLDPTQWCMSPELVSIYGTELWDGLTEEQRLKLSFYEVVNFFSLVLQGERPLVQGLVHRLYGKQSSQQVTEYLHHFVDEENKHMVMFGLFCNKYAGKVYPDKKLGFESKFTKGEAEVVFFCKVLVVEELGDYYNVFMMRDERIAPIVKELNKVHHIDEARHLSFGRLYLKNLFEKYAPEWSPERLAAVREWLCDYLKASWGDYYNPQMYADAGLPNPYDVRQLAFESPVCMAQRRQVSQKLVSLFLDVGILDKEPVL
jgi:hypothetical protein